jgi:hypothetical protein
MPSTPTLFKIASLIVFFVLAVAVFLALKSKVDMAIEGYVLLWAIWALGYCSKS